MSSPITKDKKTVQKTIFLLALKEICEIIQHSAGLYHKEGLYQDMVIKYLRSWYNRDFEYLRETVFPWKFMNPDGTDKFIIGNNQGARTDIELPQLNCIIEMKATNNITKEEVFWQLRNYLEQRDDRDWGIIVNFVSKKIGKGLVGPRVELFMMIKTNRFVTTQHSLSAINNYNNNLVKTTKSNMRIYQTYGPIKTQCVPSREELFENIGGEEQHLQDDTDDTDDEE